MMQKGTSEFYELEPAEVIKVFLDDDDLPTDADGNSNYSYERQSMVLKDIIEQRKSGNKSIIGFMLESNIKPGKQNVPAIISNLQYGVSITDACIGFKETTELIKFVYNNI